MTLAALDATLNSYQRGRALQEIPVWQMISAPASEMQARAHRWLQRLQASAGPVDGVVRESESAIGGGSLPGETLPTHVLAIRVEVADEKAAALRKGTPPVVCRIQQDHLLFDPRTVLPEQEEALLSQLIHILASHRRQGV